MSNKLENKPTRVSANEMADVAAQGVKRALEARNAAGVSLTEEELDQVSGGMFYSPDYFPHGILIGDWIQNISFQPIDQIEEIGAVTVVKQ